MHRLRAAAIAIGFFTGILILATWIGDYLIESLQPKTTEQRLWEFDPNQPKPKTLGLMLWDKATK